MTTENTAPETDASFKLLEEEVNAERSGFDLFDRLTKRPMRKPEVVTIYLDEEVGAELGYAVPVTNEYGIATGIAKAGALGELHDARAVPEADRDEKLIKKLEAQVRELAERARKNSLTVTLQWVPPLVEKAIEIKAMRSIGVKQKPLPKDRIDDYTEAWLARALEASVVSIVDNFDGSVKHSLTVPEARILQEQTPKEQYARLDVALNTLLNRKAISDEALDNADF